MNYQKKYYYTFRDLENKQFRVEIWEDNEEEVTYEEIRGGNIPFIINYPDKKDKFQPVWGSGADFNILSTTNMKFVNLATGDMFKYMVKLIEIVYITPTITQEVVRWLGYLNPEMYEEPFEDIDNYMVSFTANDGFAILDRIAYTSEIDGSRIDTIGSNWITLYNTFYRMGLPYEKLYVGISTTISGITIGANETFFHYNYGNPDNWYNEDGEPETYRTVLEKILSPIGAYIYAFEGNLYITDNNHILTTTGNTRDFKVFDLQDSLNYLATQTIDINIGDLSTIGFASDKQTYTIIPAYNKQLISYNRYRLTEPLNYLASEDGFTQQGSTASFGDSLYGYNVTSFSGSEFWTPSNGSNFIFFQGTGTENKDKFENGLRFEPRTGFTIGSGSLSFTTTNDLPYFISSGNYSLKLEAVVHPHTWTNFGISPNPDDLDPNEFIIAIDVHTEIIIDNEVGTKKKYYNPYYQFVSGATTSWVDVGTPNTDAKLRFSKPNKYKLIKDNNWNFEWEYTPANDIDVDLKVWRKSATTTVDEEGNIVYEVIPTPYLIPLNTNASGRLLIKLYDYDVRFLDFSGGIYTPGDQAHWNLYLKEIRATIVDQYGKEVKKLDMEIVGDSKNSPLQSMYKEEGDEVKQYFGTNAGSYPTENGSMLKLSGTAPNQSYVPHTLFTRQGVTDLPEYLLMRSIVSNYKDNTIRLNLTSNRLEKMLGYLTYNNYLSGKKFTITGIKRNVADSSDDLTIEEFFEDNVTINKIYI